VNKRKLPTKKLHSRTDNYKDLMQGRGQRLELQGQGQGLTSLEKMAIIAFISSSFFDCCNAPTVEL